MIGIDNKDQWHLERWGKFTASEIGKLLSKGAGTEMFGAGAKTYIAIKARELMTEMWERPDLENVKAIFHGKAYEGPAYDEYVRYTRNFSMRYFGSDDPVFLDYDANSGGSPDGMMGEGESVIWGLELKCPRNSGIHLDYMKFKNQHDLLDYDPLYYSQIQFLLMITKAQGWHFSSYDERFKHPKMRVKVLDVLPDRKFQDNLAIRLRMAVKERDRIVEAYLSAL